MAEKRSGCLSKLALLFILGTASGLILLVKDPNDPSLDLKDPVSRVVLCIAFIIWGFFYYAADETHWKIVFGIVQFVGAMWSNWYQLAKLAEEGGQKQLYERLVFVAAGIAVIAHGFSDIEEGYKKWQEAKAKKIAEKPT